MIDLSFKDIFSRIEKAKLGDFDLVVGIKEGGLIPSILAAYKLNCALEFIKVRHRDENNEPIFDTPRAESTKIKNGTAEKILIVDDVSVTGKTLDTVKKILGQSGVKTLVLKGKADHVLFPEIDGCVNWPWR
ncbi:MAG: phosphoribosyltransferase [Candidatus Omnitrophota bacterium]